MGAVYRKAYTMPLPAGAEIIDRGGVQIARWRLRNSKARSAQVVPGDRNGELRVRGRSSFYTAKYRDGSGEIVEISTGCRDETAARQVLADLVKRSERVRAGLVSAAEDTVIDHRRVSLDRHIEAYLTFLRNKQVSGRRVSAHHCRNVDHNLRRMVRECRFERLSNITRLAVERWLAQREAEGLSARTRNAHLAALVAFCNWCVQTSRMIANPLHRMSKANEKADPRRQRRALTEAELVRLLEAARRRPLLEAMTVRRGPRKGQAVAKVRDETRRSLEQLGRERALIYKTLVLTGLRKGELASLTVGHLELPEDGSRMAYAVLKPQDEKNGRGSEIPIRSDLANDLRCWLAMRLKRAQIDARRRRAPIPTRLPSETPLFNVPDGLIRIFDLDLVAAGLAKRVKTNGKWVIEKRDGRGRTIDIHALRHSFATHLSRGGVAPRTAQAALRHSTLELTMNTYTDPRLLDVAGALDVLPELPLEHRDVVEDMTKLAACAGAPPVGPVETANHLAPNLAPTGGSPWPPLATRVKTESCGRSKRGGPKRRTSGARDQRNARLATPDSSGHEQRAKGLEPSTFSLEG